GAAATATAAAAATTTAARAAVADRGRRVRVAAARRARLGRRRTGPRRAPTAFGLSRGVHPRPLRRFAVDDVPRRAVALLPAHRHRRFGLRRGRRVVPALEDRRAVAADDI